MARTGIPAFRARDTASSSGGVIAEMSSPRMLRYRPSAERPSRSRNTSARGSSASTSAPAAAHRTGGPPTAAEQASNAGAQSASVTRETSFPRRTRARPRITAPGGPSVSAAPRGPMEATGPSEAKPPFSGTKNPVTTTIRSDFSRRATAESHADTLPRPEMPLPVLPEATQSATSFATARNCASSSLGSHRTTGTTTSVIMGTSPRC